MFVTPLIYNIFNYYSKTKIQSVSVCELKVAMTYSGGILSFFAKNAFVAGKVEIVRSN